MITKPFEDAQADEGRKLFRGFSLRLGAFA
jgi:hypothetical protein